MRAGKEAASSGPAHAHREGNSEASAHRSRRNRPPTASEQLEELLGYPWPIPGRPPRHDLSTWIVTDDWPDPVPVTETEIAVFERWFGDLFDELFNLSDP